MHIEQLGALVGGVFIFTKVVGAIKALVFAKDIVSKLAHDDREDLIVQHVFMEHKTPLKYCLTDQCIAL